MSLKISQLTKRFGTNDVLRGIDLSLEPGTITAFMGANGAGKSTLVKIVAGVHAATGGAMTLDGRPFAPATPSAALRAGVVVVHQIINDNVVLTMDVLENLMIDRLCAGGNPLFRRGAHRAEAQAMLDRVGLDVPLSVEMADLSLADRQMVAIARALAHDPKLLILDEPTSALSDSEAERLFSVVEGLRDQDVPILYISHRMGDIRRLADRIVTLRDGRVTGDFGKPLDYAGAVRAMLGAALDAADHARVPAGAPILQARGLRVLPGAAPLNLDLRAAEVTAVVGLVGAGKTELAETLYGLRRPQAGTMTLDGAPYAPRDPGGAVARGVFMAAEDRIGGSIVPEFDLARNVTLPFLGAFTQFGILRRDREAARAVEAIQGLGIVAQGPDDPIGSLSGGNQQKVILARWLTAPARVLILDEPFQGVDIAARRDIGGALRATAGERATLVLCADLDEAIEVADRILILSHGALRAEQAAGGLDRAALVDAMSAAA